MTHPTDPESKTSHPPVDTQQELFQMDEEWEAEWQGMPEYVSKNREAAVQVVLNFETLEDMRAFNKVTGLSITPQTRGVFYPVVPPHNMEYVDDEPFNTIEFKGVKAFIREGTSDEFIVHEVIGNAYKKLNIETDDVILDIGMNIGMFSVWAFMQGAAVIHGYEPEPENYKLACRNLKLNGYDSNAHPVQAAVTGNDDASRDFSINVKKNKGLHSLIPKRGRDTITVDCVNINNLIAEHDPTIIKMDIEGGEYEILTSIKSWGNVREVIMEFHNAHLGDIQTHEKYNEVLGILNAEFQIVNARKADDLGGAWTAIIHASQGIYES
jgi:FkbM family methyltransferase